MLNNIKIGTKLIGGFVVVALFTFLIGILGISNMGKINTMLNTLYDKHLIGISHTKEANINLIYLGRAVRNMILAQNLDERQKHEKNIEKYNQTLRNEVEQAEKTIVSAEGKVAIKKVKDQYEEYYKVLQDFIGVINKQPILKIDQTITDGLASTRVQADDVDQAMSELSVLKEQYGKKMYEESDTIYASMKNILIICVIFASIAGILIGFFLSISISKPLTKVVSKIQEMAKGHLGDRLRINRKDEIGILAQAMDDFSEDLQNNIVATVKKIGEGDLSSDIKPKDNQDEITPAIMNTTVALRGLITEAGMLRKAAIEGKLATRGQADNFKGGYKEIVQGVNETLDAVIGPLNVAAEYVDRISKGDVPQKITDKYNGDFNEIKNNLNQCIDAVNNLVADANILSKAAVEGKLATRADASKHQGDFRKIVQGVNDCLDAVIGPLNVAAEYVDRISKGDIPQKISDNYSGDFNEIKNNLNQCIDAVNTLVADANLLSKAAVEGKLATRADASKHQGDFRKIVQGVDDCLDAVIGPLNVAAKYVDDISKGVIPPSITDNYNGDFNTIKNNLNSVVKMMSDLLKETDVIVTAAAEGELDKRADASKFVGGWNQLVSGVNSTITNIVNPLMVTADYVDKVSKGVIPPEITTVYKGQYNIIKNNLNNVVKMMGQLLSETDKLVKAAINGQLETRANATLFVGGWNQLVDGVNKTLEAVLGPINEAAMVLEKVAARDMTARVQGDYKGDLAKIKNALNMAVDNLDKALQQVTEATEQVTSAGGQISSGSQSLAQGANEQASSLEEVSSSLEEMASMTKQNADNANQAKGLAAESDTNAKSGAEAMDRMSSAINRIKESSDQTAKIVKTIDEIAMQTNLLALNAAVEAARAGEAGRGFAVVAEEVRNLAQRSAQAAKNTADMITESVKNADDGVKIATEVSQSFETIAGSAKKVNDLIAEIAAASQEQSSGIEQINTAVAQMDKVTQQNAANSEESASAAEELSSQAEELKNMISQFALSHTMMSSSTPRRVAAAAHTVVHAPVKEKSNYKAIGKKPMGKSTSIRPEDIIPLDDEALKEF